MANVFSGNPYDAQMSALGAVKPKVQVDPRQAIEGLATKYNVPANVLIALDEASGGKGLNSESYAKAIAAGVSAGKSVDAIIAEAAGDPARATALMNRAYDIADEMYPQPAKPAPSGPSVVGDLGRQLGGSIVKGGGAMVEGVGQMVDTAANAAGRAVSPVVEALTGQKVGETSLGRDTGVAVGDAVRDVGEGIHSGVSPEGKQALMDSTPDGSIFDPANATFGKNPSVRGYSMLAADVLGSLLPVVATAIITKSPGAAAGVGGAMGGGAGSEEARQIVQDAAKNIGPDGISQLEKESALYRELVASGQSPAQALDKVTREAESLAFLLTAPISALGGGVTGAIATKPIAGLAGRGIAARAAGTAAISGVEEGIQEAAESMATRFGTGQAAQMPIDITEGTFGDFILGALGGAPVGAVAGAANRRREPQPEAAPPAGAPPEVLALPAPNNGGTIFGEGPVGPGPADPTNFERDPSAPRETLSDGSGQGQAAPPLSSPVPPPGADGAAAPLGPIASIAAAAPDLTPIPEVAPVEVPPMFSEMKPGAQVRLEDPSGAIVDAVFQREEEGVAIVRINGQEIGVDPAAFDQAVQAARRADLEAEAKAKGAKAPKPKAVPKPKPVKLSEQAVASVAPAPEPDITPEQAAKAAKVIEDRAAKEGWTKGLRKKHDNLVTLAGEAYSPKPARSSDAPDSMGSPAPDATGQNIDPETGEVSQRGAEKGKADPPVVAFGATPDGDVDGADTAGQRGNSLTANRDHVVFGTRDGLRAKGHGNLASVDDVAAGENFEFRADDGSGAQIDLPRNGTPKIALRQGKVNGKNSYFVNAVGFTKDSSGRDGFRGVALEFSGGNRAEVEAQALELFHSTYPDAPRDNAKNKSAAPAPAATTKPAQNIPENIPAPELMGEKPAKSNAKPGLLSALSQEKQDRAAELKSRLAAKARSQTSSGLDPEYITLGGELVALYIEAGTKKFGQMLRDFAETTGLSMREAQAPMRAAYNHVRDDMDLNGEDISGMDSSDQVMAEVRKALAEGDAKPEAKAAPAAEADPFIAAGFTIPKDTTARILKDEREGKGGNWLIRSAGTGKFRVTKTNPQVGSVAIPTRTIGVFNSPEEAIAAVRADGAPLPAPEVPTAKEVAAAATVTDPNPTQAQAEAENYRTGKTEWNGLTLSIENKKGGKRRGFKADGSVAWEVTMPAHYGRILRTEGADGDHVDFYLGDVTDSDYVMIIDQVDAKTGAFDEHKIVLGTTARGAALDIYRGAFSDGSGDKRIGGFTETNVGTFKAWLKSADMSKPSKPLSYPFAAKDSNAAAPAAPPAVKPKTPKQKRDERKAALADFFTPGNIVGSYGGGADRVISFDPTDDGGFTVTVESVVKQGDEWVKNPQDMRVRTHRTTPTDRELRRGPIYRAPVPEAPAADTATEKPKPTRPKAKTLQKRPLIHRVREGIGQIDPDGTFGKEAYARGLNAQTAPGLFKRGALKNLDNIPAAEHPEVAQIVGIADDGNYLDQDRLLELMLEEVAGRAQPIGDQAVLQQEEKERSASDAADRTADLAAEQEAGTGYEPVSAAIARDWFIPDPERDMRTSSERDQDIRDALADVVEAYSISALTQAEIANIVSQLDVAGGSVLAAIEQTFARGVNDAIQSAEVAEPPAGANPDLSEPPFGPEDEARYLDGEEGGTGTAGEGRPEPATGGARAGGSGNPETTGAVSAAPAFEPGADGKPQAIMPGMEGGADQRQSALTARQKAEIEARQQQSKMRRLGGNEGDAGPLFGDGPKDLFDAPAVRQADAPATPQPTVKPQNPATAAKIEDFGEKIGGARKDVWAGFKDKMEAAQDLDIKVEPLSKSWPEPDYEKLIEAGMDPWAVSFVRAARDMIPRKPGKSWKLRGWADQVKVLRDFASDILTDKISTERLKERLAAAPDLDKKISGKIALYDAVGHGQSLKELSFGEHTYSMLGGEYFDKPRTFWEVTKDQAATAWSNMPKTLARGDTRDDALAKFKATFKPSDAADATKKKSGTKFLIYSQRGAEGAKYKIGVKIGSTYLDLQTGISEVKEARRVVAEESDRLQAKLDQMRTIPNERRDENAPRLGADHRNGADVSPEQFGETFGFRGIEFGNWVEQGRRKQDMNDAYDALMDMASILDIPPKAISLNGSLGLAFGARGAGGKNPAAAHFEPGKVVINLTKRSGRGSLAHEWFHALDNYFARKRAQQRGTYITDNNSPGGPLTEGVRPETVDAFLAVKRAIANTKLKERSSKIDQLRSSPYWGTGIEMHARAFESYIIAKLQDQNASNDYLANIVNGLSWSMQAELSGLGDAYPYLKPEEVETVRPRFDALFAGMDRRETDKGVALEMREFAPDTDAPIAETDISAITKDLNAELARTGLGGKVSVRVVRKLVSHVSGNAIAGRFGAAEGIAVSAASSVPQIGVMRHEIIHALRSENLWNRPGGLFTPAEWRGLVKAARAEPEIVASVMQRYKDQPSAMQAEEMVAELYRLWADQRDGYDGVAKALAKVEAFLQAMANMLRGRGFGSAALTLERIASGKVGGRGPQGPGGRNVQTDQNAQNVQDAAEMRAPAGAIRDKFKNLVGFRNWRDPKEFLRNLTTDAMTGDQMSILALVPGRALFSEMGGKMLSTKRYLRAKEEMDTLRNDWHAEASTVAQEWMDMQKGNPAANEALMDLMHRSTLTGVDPSKPDTWGKDDASLRNAKMEVSKLGDKAPDWAKQKLADAEKRKTSYSVIKGLYDAMPPEYQAFYVKVKDSYEKLADDFDQALEENIKAGAKIALKRAEKEHRKTLRQIEDDGLTGEERETALNEAEATLAKVRTRAESGAAGQIKAMRKVFEGQRLKGPYFPLARFGDYFVTVRDEDGKVINFSRFENEKRQQVFRAEQEELNPGRVSFGLMSKKGDMRDQVDPKFVSDVEMLLADSGASSEVMDAIWQRYLETMPDQSIRTSKIHRKGREGFNKDALRSYTSHTFHGAHQLARLKYGLELQDALDDAEDEARRADDPNRATALVNEMRKRMEWTMNPTGSAWSAAASSMAFVWYLGVSPAAALVNISQTTVIGPAVFKAGLKNASMGRILTELGRAAKDFGKGQGVSWKDTWSAENSDSLSADEKAAMKEGYRRGTIDKTQAHDLAAVAESGVEFSPFREKWMRRIGFAFHHAERVNREVTFLAAYRLARAEGMSHADAIEKGSDLTWKTHFSYQNSDRPRFMQGDIPKVLFIFRQFSVNVLYRLFRDAHQSLQGATKAERKEARTQLVGISLSMMAHAGIKGVWGYGLLMSLLGMFVPGADDDDIEEWMQDALLMEGDGLGVAAANFAMGAFLSGVPGHLTGAALTERIGSPNLWFRGSDRNLEGEDVVQHYINELAGPIGGIVYSVFGRGLPALAEGEVVRGVEALTPKFVRDVVRTGRFATEGATTRNGDTLIEDVNPWELILQANGFTPARLAERYEINTRLKNKEKEITDQRKDLHRAASDAIKAGEPIPEKVMDKIRAFNAAVPEYPITAKTIKQSYMGRMRASERNEFGVALNPKLNDRLRGDLAPALYD